MHVSTKPSNIKDLALLFSVPFAIAVIAVVITYVPRQFAHPSYDFVYEYCPSYYCSDSYALNASGQLDLKELVQPSYPNNQSTQLVYYDAASDSTHQITFAEASGFTYINSSKSPDGYVLIYNQGGSDFLLFRASQDVWQLQNGFKRRTVQLEGTKQNFSSDVNFLGWVKK